MRLKTVLFIFLISIFVQTGYSQSLFPTPNQNVKDALSLATSLYTGNKSKLRFENKVKTIVSISSSTRDPEDLVREYKQKMKDLQYEADKRKQQKEQELERQIALIERGLNEALRAADVNLDGVAGALLSVAASATKAAAKANARKKIEAAKRKAEQDLDNEMRSAMGTIYDEIVKENEKSQKEYLVAAAQVFSEREESKYIEYFEFHNCVLESMKKNYNYKNANWVKTSCPVPSKIYSGYQSKPKLEYGRYNNSTQSAGSDVDFSTLSTDGQIAAVDKKLEEALKTVEDLIAKTDDAFKKVEYLDLKQSLIDKAKDEKEAIKNGTETTVAVTAPTTQKSQYQPLLDVAIRKMKLYKGKMPYKEFYESAKEYAEAELAENSSNGNAYIFLADLTTDVKEKYRLTGYALYLNRSDASIKDKFNKAKTNFGKKLYKSIESQQNSYVSDANNQGLLNGFQYLGKTPFEFAVAKDNAQVMEMLMPQGTNKYELLYFAIESGGTNIAKSLIRRLDINSAPKLKGYDLLTATAQFDRKKIAYTLLEKGFYYNSSLELAKYSNRDLYLKLTSLLSRYAIKTSSATMLDNIVQKAPEILKPQANGENIVDEIVKENKTVLLPVLIKHGLDVRNASYSYLLELAINSNAEDIGVSLIQQGIDVHFSPTTGGTFINLLSTKQGMDGLFDQLLNKGVSVAAFNNNNEFALMTSMKSKQKEKTIKLLKKNSPLGFRSKLNGNPMHWIIENGIEADFIRILAENHINIDALDKNGDSPLMFALKKKTNSYVGTLLQHGANVNTLNNKQVSPLQYAIFNKSQMYGHMIDKCKDTNVEGINGWTALHFAVREGNLDAVKRLVNANASLTVADKWGRTPYRIAREQGQEEIKKVLKKKMGVGAIVKTAYVFNKKKPA